MNKQIGISILGSTGSIGTQTIEVIKQFPKKFRVIGLSANENIEAIAKQIKELKPVCVSMQNYEAAEKLKEIVNGKTEVLNGTNGMQKIATLEETSMVVTAVVGSIGIKPTISAIKAKKNIALANKETLVAAGSIVMKEVKKNNIGLMPIDSEHCALKQCLNKASKEQVQKLIITCSGGPFKFKKKKELENITIEQALGHPTWKMGAKITIDSATLFNKGLEIIEAHWLYDMPYEKIAPIMHPQSIVHSLVEFVDGNLMAQLSTHDMRLPIQYALCESERMANDFPKLQLEQVQKLEFFPIDTETFPSINYAIEAGKTNGTMPCVLNAANEEAVNAFLKNKTSFLSIFEIVKKTMKKHKTIKQPSLEEIFEADEWARKTAKKIIEEGKN